MCKNPRVSKGDTLNVEHIALADGRVFARYAGAASCQNSAKE